jgi:hypothetical protein
MTGTALATTVNEGGSLKGEGESLNKTAHQAKTRQVIFYFEL